MEGRVELEDKKEPDVKTKIKESERYIPIDCYRQARIALEMMKTNQEGKTGYEEVLEKIRGTETGSFTPSYSQVWGEMFGPDAPTECCCII